MPTPKDYGVPHSTWRPAQWDAIQQVQALHNNGGGTVFAELCTGSGKSGVATALGAIDKVTIFTSTLSLLDQYAAQYGVDIVKGRQAYPCALRSKVELWRSKYGMIPTAHDCSFDPMHRCPAAAQCTYLAAKTKALHSQRMACSYKYGTLSRSLHGRTGILVFDECDTSVGEVVSYSTIEFRRSTFEGHGITLPHPIAGMLRVEQRALIIQWIVEALSTIPEPHERDESYAAAQAARLRKRLDKYLEALQGGEWFVSYNNEGDHAGILLRPLTVQEIISTMQEGKHTTLCMSATIGDPEPLAAQLGISTYLHYSYPHPTPVQYRPVQVLPGMPRMTKSHIEKNDNLLAMQAVRIRIAVQQLPDQYRGMVLTTSHYKAQVLRESLSEWFGDRIIQHAGNASERLHNFLDSTQPGAILVDTIQGFGHGVDLRGDLGRFVVVAGVPFDNPSDTYCAARAALDGGKYGLWTAYNSVVQACGRVTRGELEQNIGILADGSCSTARAVLHYPSWFVDAMGTALD
jgi:hypothetical protein